MSIDSRSGVVKRGGFVRLLGVDLPADKNVMSALPRIFGIGKRNVFDICKAVGIDLHMKMRDVSNDQTRELLRYMVDEKGMLLEGDLRSKIDSDKKRLVNINCYRGLMHKRRLPVRGQRTRTNARTRKGPRKSFGKK